MEIRSWLQIDHSSSLCYTFCYTTRGCAHNPPILFLHGFMGDRHEFDQVIDALCDRYYCLTVDLPGHGNTIVSHDQAYAMIPTAQALIKFLDQLAIASCFLVGYSMGGRIALYLTLHFPSYFQKVILESASPGLKSAAERTQRLESDRRLAQELESLESPDLLAFLKKWYDQPLFATTKAHPNFKQLLAQRLNNSPRHLAKSLVHLSLGQQPSLWPKLENNQVPLLLLVGALDPKFMAINSHMASLCPLFQLQPLDHCGHNTHFENPQLFTRQIANFLE